MDHDFLPKGPCTTSSLASRISSSSSLSSTHEDNHVDHRSRGLGSLHASTMSLSFLELPEALRSYSELQNTHQSDVSPRAHYSPPWANTSIIGIAGSSGSGKTSLSVAIIKELSLPWVVILSMDSFYKPLTPEQSRSAFRNEYDFDAPEAIDFDALVDKLRDIKSGYDRGPIIIFGVIN